MSVLNRVYRLCLSVVDLSVSARPINGVELALVSIQNSQMKPVKDHGLFCDKAFGQSLSIKKKPRVRFLIPAILIFAISCLQTFAGYTHYFTWHEKPKDAELKACVGEMNLLIEVRKSMLVSPDVEGAVPGSLKLETMHVDFNGIGDDAHEPFVFPGTDGFNFCKTAYKPYDEVVTACLLVARDHFPPSVLSISSDGSWEDWTNGATLYNSVFHRPARIPFTSDYIPDSRRGLAAFLFVLVVVIAAAWFWWKRRGQRF